MKSFAKMRTKVQCDVCEKYFVEANLQRHREAVHLKLRPYECTKCDKKFTDATPLRYHMKLHDAGDTRNYECDICKKTYKTEHMLTAHKQRSHVLTGVKCQYCGKVSKNKYQLQRHEEAHFA